MSARRQASREGERRPNPREREHALAVAPARRLRLRLVLGLGLGRPRRLGGALPLGGLAHRVGEAVEHGILARIGTLLRERPEQLLALVTARHDERVRFVRARARCLNITGPAVLT